MNGASGELSGAQAPASLARVKFESWLWLAQRASAVLLAFCVLVHLATIVYAVHKGLSGAAILGRTRGNAIGLGFYFLYVLAIAVHAPIGLRTVCQEWLGWRDTTLDWATAALACLLFALGLRAGWAVFA